MKKLAEKWKNAPLSVKAAAAYTFCNVLLKCVSFLTMPLFTRLLTKEEYGQYTVYQSWQIIFSILLTLNLAYGSFSKAMVKFEDRRDEYIASSQGICLVFSVAFLAIYLPFASFWNGLLNLTTPLVLLMVGEILTYAAFMFWSGKKRFEFKYKSVVAVTLLISVLSPLLALLLVLVSDEKGVARIVGYVIPTIVIGSALFVINMIRGKTPFRKEYWKYALGFNLPLLAYYFSQTIFNQSDRIMIERIIGMGDAAQYGVAYNLAMILTFVLNAVNNSYVPWYYGKIKTGKQEENRSVSALIALLMAILILFIIWFAPEIIRLMAGEAYRGSEYVVPPVAMSLLLLFYSQLFINVEFYYEAKHLLIISSVAAAVLNVVLNALLIPTYGFVAAGYTTLASYALFLIGNFFAMKHVLKKNGVPDNSLDYKWLLIILAAFTAVAFGGMFLYQWLIPRIAGMVLLALFAFLYRKKLIGFWKKLKER